MNKKDLAYFKNLIMEKKQKISMELGYLEQSSMNETMKDSTGDLSAYSFHMADHGTDTMEREKAFMITSPIIFSSAEVSSAQSRTGPDASMPMTPPRAPDRMSGM